MIVMYNRKEIDKELKSFDKFMKSNNSPETKLTKVLEHCIFFNIQNSLHYLYEKLTTDPVYRGNGTFENFAASLSDKDKFEIIKLIEELCKEDEWFNKYVKRVNHSQIEWAEDSKLNRQIKIELGIK